MALVSNPTPNELTNAVRALEKSVPVLKSVNLSPNGWTATTGSEPTGYKYVITDAEITADCIVDFVQANASAEAWASIEAYPATVSANGSVTLYAKNAPTVSISGYYSITLASVEV